jgi:hypothetical protein
MLLRFVDISRGKGKMGADLAYSLCVSQKGNTLLYSTLLYSIIVLYIKVFPLVDDNGFSHQLVNENVCYGARRGSL